MEINMKQKRIVILKLGGSLITDKTTPYTPHIDIIHNLALQIKQALDEDPHLQLIIGNGSGSFAHYPASEYAMVEGIKSEEQKMGFCLVQDAAAQLNRIIVSHLLKAGVRAVSVNPSSMMVSKNGEIKEFFTKPFFGYLENGLTPVFYGDIVFDTKKGSAIFSTEKLINKFALELKNHKMPVSKIIQNGVVEGVLDKEKKVIPHISANNFKHLKKSLYAADGFDVTGGMMHKLEESLTLAQNGISTTIINGSLKESLLKQALLNKPVVGTVIA